MGRVEDGRFVHFHLKSVLQLEGPEAHQKTHGDGAHGHEQAQSDGKARQPPMDRGLWRTLTHRLTFPDNVTGGVHAESPLQGLDGSNVVGVALRQNRAEPSN